MKKIKFLLLIATLTTSLYGRIETKNTVKKDSSVYHYLDSLSKMLDSLGVEEPKYVMAQGIWETGWFKCKKCAWSNNNMFGFRAKNGKYMHFDNWRDCVVYYAKWQKKRYPKFKEKYPKGDYLQFLRWSHYSESNEYSKRIIQMYNWINANWTH
jgi:flagellum-specific peptidoglycan hydrolase FlgJ